MGPITFDPIIKEFLEWRQEFYRNKGNTFRKIQKYKSIHERID